MAKRRKSEKKDRRKVQPEYKEANVYAAPELKAITQAQGQYLSLIQSKIVTFGLGSAGSGKTYVATAYAAQLLHSRRIKKIIVTRPAVESGRGLGFLKGTLQEKYAPYLAPLADVFISLYGKAWYESQLNNGNIEAIPLEYMQGKSFDDAVVLFDEAQNSTPNEMFMLLSRIGKYTKVIINGDYKMQQMIKGTSGLEDATRRISHLNDVGVAEFTSDDIVRSGIVKDIVQAYEN